MTIITREQAIENLKRYIGQDLSELAKLHGITTFETGRQNKGWKGLVLERLVGLEASSSRDPNGLSYEIKSVSFYYVKGELVPKETMAITMINPEELKNQSFRKYFSLSQEKFALHAESDAFSYPKLRGIIAC